MEIVIAGQLAQASPLLRGENFTNAIITLIDENGYESQIHLEDVYVQGYEKAC